MKSIFFYNGRFNVALLAWRRVAANESVCKETDVICLDARKTDFFFRITFMREIMQAVLSASAATTLKRNACEAKWQSY